MEGKATGIKTKRSMEEGKAEENVRAKIKREWMKERERESERMLGRRNERKRDKGKMAECRRKDQ